MRSGSEFSDINDTFFGLALPVFRNVEVIVEEIFTMVLVVEEPSFWEEFVEVEAVGSVLVLISVTRDESSGKIFSRDTKVSWDVIVHLGHATEVLPDDEVLVVHVVEENVLDVGGESDFVFFCETIIS